MGYYFELRPKDIRHLTVADFIERLIGVDLIIHPSFLSEEDSEVREKYRDTLMAHTGLVTVHACEDSSCGVAASARMSWGKTADGAREEIRYLLEVARQVNASLMGKGDKVIEEETLEDSVQEYLGDSRSIVGNLGSCSPDQVGNYDARFDEMLRDLENEEGPNDSGSNDAPGDPSRIGA